MARLRVETKSKIKHTVGFLSIVLGGILFFTCTVWFAKSQTKSLPYSTVTALVIGILNGILQLSGGTIFLLLGIVEKWIPYSIFSLMTAIGATITFGFSLVEVENADDQDVSQELTQCLSIVAGINCAFGLVVLLCSYLSHECFFQCRCKGSCHSDTHVPYTVLA